MLCIFVWHANVYPLVWGMTLIPAAGKWDPLKLALVSISIVSLCPFTSIVACNGLQLLASTGSSEYSSAIISCFFRYLVDFFTAS